jgi:Nif-specific regulatory protein
VIPRTGILLIVMSNTPKLVSIAGPLKDATFRLNGEVFSIGRDLSNSLVIEDPPISRHHCAVTKEREGFKITDLDSRNGTSVNGVPVKERLLQHGDHIKIGRSVFVFLLHETDATTSVVELEEKPWTSRSAIELKPTDTTYLQFPELAKTVPATERTVHDLSALAGISTALASLESPEQIQRKLLDSVLQFVPAEHGAVILLGKDLEEFISVLGQHNVPGKEGPVRASRTAIQRALRDRVALLSNDVLAERALSDSDSLKAAQVRSLLAVPMILAGKALGIIYLATTDVLVQFDPSHLHLVTAIATVAGLALENARRREWLEDETQRLRTEVEIAHDMVGDSPPMQKVYRFIAKIAPSDSTVLISGETGTGKELAARAIHRNSPRAESPFVAINCAALTESLLESELFGHEKGAFTGAITQKKGKIEVADGGTLFLDEVGELAPTLQAKLLRVLQEREFERVGGTRPIKVDIRLIAATNRDLQEDVRSGRFRQDLYYRLKVVSVTLPPLRERREDIPSLASHLVTKHSRNCKRHVRGLSREAQECLLNYSWPGNVWELENAIERAVLLGSSDCILPEDLPEELLEQLPSTEALITKYHDGVREAKKQIILKAMQQAGGNYTEAAKLLGVRATYLHRLMRNLNLKASHSD